MGFFNLVFLAATVQISFGFDLATYNTQFQAQVAVPYKSAITVVATDIIEYLAQTPVPTTAEGGRQIGTNLNQRARAFSGDLGSASTSSDALKQQLDRQVESLTSQASGVEQQITANEQQLQQTNGQIQQTNAQVNDAQNQVNVAQQSLQNAERDLQQAQERISNAERCIFGWGGWFWKKICRVVNDGGISRATDTRDRNRNYLQQSQQRLAQVRAKFTQLQQQLANFQQQRAGLEATKSGLNGQLTQLNQARNLINTLNVNLKTVIAHVSTLFGKSQVLVDVIKNLIDMETVINPLTAIADQITSQTTGMPDNAALVALKQKIAVNLPLLQLKLPQYALIPHD